MTALKGHLRGTPRSYAQAYDARVRPLVAGLLLGFCCGLCCLASAQTTRTVYAGTFPGGAFNLIVSDPVLLGEEAFAVSLYESQSTLQLRRTPDSTVSYTYAGVSADGTLHLQRRLLWKARGVDTTTPLQLTLETPWAFALGYGARPAELVFSAGDKGMLRVLLVNDPPLERPQNEGF